MKQLIAILVVALALCGWALRLEIQDGAARKSQLSAKTDALERAGRRVKSDAKALVAREAKIATTARKLAQAEASLTEALQRNNDWSNTNVPLDVQEALGGAADGLPSDSESLRLRRAGLPSDSDGVQLD